MKTKLSLAVAAMILGLQIGAPAIAQVTSADLAQAEAAVNAGDVQAFRDLLAATPDLMSLTGTLGATIRAFAAAPSAATLAAVRDVTPAAGLSVSVASTAAAADTIY